MEYFIFDVLLPMCAGIMAVCVTILVAMFTIGLLARIFL